jgi:protein transport protein SEC13
MDYYGKRLATCSSDKTIKIFNVTKNTQTHETDLVGHDGPVWQIAWAHPKFGTILASCSYDRKVIIWTEEQPNQWRKTIFTEHELSVNSLAWAPHEFGLTLLCGSSDGTVSILTQKGPNNWSKIRVTTHKSGVNSVSWAPYAVPSSLLNSTSASSPSSSYGRFATGSADNTIKIWNYNFQTENCEEETTLSGHTDWVRDVAWAPNVGLPYSTIASGGQDGTVRIWTQLTDSAEWVPTVINYPSFLPVVWRVSWSITGNILAVSGGNNEVTLWKESVDKQWNCISTLEENKNTTD